MSVGRLTPNINSKNMMLHEKHGLKVCLNANEHDQRLTEVGVHPFLSPSRKFLRSIGTLGESQTISIILAFCHFIPGAAGGRRRGGGSYPFMCATLKSDHLGALVALGGTPY